MNTAIENVRVGAVFVFIALFIGLKIFFLFHTPQALIWAAVPATLLILSESSEAY